VNAAPAITDCIPSTGAVPQFDVASCYGTGQTLAHTNAAPESSGQKMMRGCSPVFASGLLPAKEDRERGRTAGNRQDSLGKGTKTVSEEQKRKEPVVRGPNRPVDGQEKPARIARLENEPARHTSVKSRTTPAAIRNALYRAAFRSLPITSGLPVLTLSLNLRQAVGSLATDRQPFAPKAFGQSFGQDFSLAQLYRYLLRNSAWTFCSLRLLGRQSPQTAQRQEKSLKQNNLRFKHLVSRYLANSAHAFQVQPSEPQCSYVQNFGQSVGQDLRQTGF
jgi:hypothetical protein